jgi:hypothetical protein
MEMHPTSTAGNGRRKFERIGVKGDPVKHIIACAQCGYSFVETRDREERSDQDGNEVVVNTVVINNVQSNLPIHLRGMTSFSASSRDVDDPEVREGCPLCGTFNPRGLDRTPEFSSIDVSDR